MADAVTDASFDERGPAERQARARRLLGRVVRPVPRRLADPRQIAEERADELKLVKVNIDENQDLAQRYGVMSIPMMVLFKDGEPAAAAVGAQPKGAARALARPRRVNGGPGRMPGAARAGARAAARSCRRLEPSGWPAGRSRGRSGRPRCLARYSSMAITPSPAHSSSQRSPSSSSIR